MSVTNPPSEVIIAQSAESHTAELPLQQRVTKLEADVELYRTLYNEALARCRNLEKGLLSTHQERMDPEHKQLTLGILASLLGEQNEGDEHSPTQAQEDAPPAIEVKPHTRRKGGGRSKLPEHLPRVQQTILPQEVLDEGLDSFELIGEERSQTLERQTSSLYVVETIRPKFVRRDRERDRSQDAQRQRDLAAQSYTHILVAEPPVHPLPKAMAGPGLLADTVVSRFEDHLPLYRLERIFKREGLKLHRSTICSWHTGLAQLIKPLLDAMWADARAQPILYTDATGVRVRAKKKCRRAHFWAVIAPHRHILYAFTKDHKKGAVDALLGGFSGHLVADAHTVYDHLYVDGDVIEVGCWAHARRYLHKTLESQPQIALVGLAWVNEMFRLERRWKPLKPEKRCRLRELESKPLVEGYFKWCESELEHALEDTPLYRALNYSLNQRDALERFLSDGRLPLHNNASERALRRQAIGRKNWLFLGNNQGGHTNAGLVTLLASCALHEIEPRAYLRDLFCLLPCWSREHLIELAPLQWKDTRARTEVEATLMRNTHWRAATGVLCDTPA